MKTTTGGQNVKAGFYWNRNEWEMVALSGEGGTLPGNPEAHYVKVPVLFMLAMAPIMGALYVVFLPVLGFFLVFQHLGKKAAEATGELVHETAGNLGMAWRPGEAWFAARRARKTGTKGEAPTAPKANPTTTDAPKEGHS